jgi:acyl-CoA thioesterase
VGGAFDEDVAVEQVGDGRYRAELSDRWNLRPLPQGGIVTAVALRAMQAALGDDDQRLRTSHTTFAAQVAHGPLEVDVEVLRRGRSMSQVRAEVRNPGATRGHLTIATFGTTRSGFDLTDGAPPVVPPPDACRSFRGPLPPGVPTFEPSPFWDQQIDSRQALGHPPWEPYEPAGAERASWVRFDEPPIRDDGTLDPLALVVLSDAMPGAVAEGLGPTDRQWFGPSVDLTVHLLQECRAGWVLAHNRARHVGDGYASADMHLWEMGGATPRLVAYATQLFFFTFLG